MGMMEVDSVSSIPASGGAGGAIEQTLLAALAAVAGSRRSAAP
jgi:hypothetical protein